MKKAIALALALGLTPMLAAAEVNEKASAFGKTGKVIEAEASEQGAVLTAEGYYGYHMDQEPNVTLRVTLSPDCVIDAVELVSMKDQTPGFGDLVTEDSLAAAYVGRTALETMDADAVTGATLTSQAALYAVRTAAHYAVKALGYVPDTTEQDKEELREVYPAEYESIVSDY